MKLRNQGIIPQNGNSPKMTSNKKSEDLPTSSTITKLAVHI